jgi:hypothetical protein
MLKAAIYARKSTDDSNRNPENKSVARQVDNANAYAQTKGWAVDERHIYERLNAELAECGDRLDIDIDDRQLKQMLSTQMGRFNELMTAMYLGRVRKRSTGRARCCSEGRPTWALCCNRLL